MVFEMEATLIYIKKINIKLFVRLVVFIEIKFTFDRNKLHHLQSYRLKSEPPL